MVLKRKKRLNFSLKNQKKKSNANKDCIEMPFLKSQIRENL